MPVAKEQIRQIISENNLNNVADVYALLRDSFDLLKGKLLRLKSKHKID